MCCGRDRLLKGLDHIFMPQQPSFFDLLCKLPKGLQNLLMGAINVQVIGIDGSDGGKRGVKGQKTPVKLIRFCYHPGAFFVLPCQEQVGCLTEGNAAKKSFAGKFTLRPYRKRTHVGEERILRRLRESK